MASSLNLRVKAVLDALGFKSGAKAIRAELTSLKSQFLGFSGALGAGLGLFKIVSEMKDTAVKLNVARATLKNVSKDTVEYGDNLSYVQGLSEKYHQDLITLTDSFSRFHAAAMGTNFSLEQQKDMYEGLVQAATYFHMSSERTENMLVAVEQMMSKGKVTAEELRRQLGNNLPGAYAKMAQAAISSSYKGIKSFADFEKAMKNGQIGVELLTKFIDQLKEETADFQTDSLVLKMNDLKNAFIKFTESSNFEEWFTKAIDTAIKGLGFIEKHIKAIGTTLKVVFGGWIIKNFIVAINAAVQGLSKIASVLKKIWLYSGNIIDVIGQIGKFFAGAGGVFSLLAGSAAVVEGRFIKIHKSIKNVNTELEKLIELEGKLSEANKKEYAKTLDAAARRDFAITEEYFKTHPKDGEWIKQQRALASITDQDIALAGTMGAGASGALREQRANAEAAVREYETMVALQDRAIADMTEAALAMGKGVLKTYEDVKAAADDWRDSEAAKIVQKYLEKEKELNNQRKNQSITQDEYNSSMTKLTEDTWKSLTALDNFRSEIAGLQPNLSQFDSRIKDLDNEFEKGNINLDVYNGELKNINDERQEEINTVNKLKSATKQLEENFGKLGLYKSMEELTQVARDYYTEAYKQQALLKDELQTKEDFNKEVDKAAEKAVEAMYAIKNLGTVISMLDPITQQVIAAIFNRYKQASGKTVDNTKANELNAQIDKALAGPTFESTRFAYKQTQVEQYDRLAKAYKDWAKTLQDAIDDAKKNIESVGVEKLNMLEAALKEAETNMTNFRDLADIHEWMEDIKTLKKELWSAKWETIEQAAGALSHLTSEFKSMKKVFEDGTEWEKFIAVLDAVIASVNNIIGMIRVVNTLTQISKDLSAAKHAEELRALAAENGFIAGQNALKAANIGLTQQQSQSNLREAGTALAAGSANSAEAVGGAVASGAKMPFPQNLIAMAVGAATAAGLIAAMVAAVKANFASGGVVGGNSYHGDRIIAGLNSGEMVINPTQQGNLWRLLNGQGSVANGGGGGKVEFVISGQNLKGVLKNYETVRKG